MPTKPLKPCNQPGCPELTRGRYCPKHATQSTREYDKKRGTAAERGYGSRWQKARLTFLRHNPLCVECLKEGRPKAATVVDHKIPHKGNQTLFWDRNNWQALCKQHHDIKTAREDGGFGHGVRG